MRSQQKKKKRIWLKITSSIILLMIVAVGIYGFMVYRSVSGAVETMHQPIKYKTEKRVQELTLTEQEPFSVLLLGVDERDGDKGRSDTMIVVTVNPDDQSMKMLSIPRDTRTEIIGKNFDDKINHAYAFGNEEMAMATVENFLDIPIDYFIKVNMEGFKDIVDAVNGITVNSSLAFEQGRSSFTEGTNHLNGDEALSYVRMRKEDPNGDFGRQERQRQVIQGVIKKGISLNTITNYDDILDALGKNVRTNLSFNEMRNIQKNYKGAVGKVEQLTISGEGQRIDNIWYLIVSNDEQIQVQEELKTHLGI